MNKICMDRDMMRRECTKAVSGTSSLAGCAKAEMPVSMIMRDSLGLLMSVDTSVFARFSSATCNA